jgi:uncharacterized protein YbjQ (UPF0145 family)
MLYSTLNQPSRPGVPFETLGLCDAVYIKAFNAWKTFTSNFKSTFGARLTELEDDFYETRHFAIKECGDACKQMGGDEVIGLRVDVSEISRGQNADSLLEVYCYGTAIRYLDNKTPKKKSKK